MKTCIIEDELHAQQALRLLIEEIAPEIQIMGMAQNVAEGKTLIAKHQPDFIFLDVKLGKQSGFDLLKYYPNPNFKILFVTAYEEFAVEAFKWNAIHYITKPIDSASLRQGIAKVKAQQALPAPSQLASLLEQVQTQKEHDKIVLAYHNFVEQVLLDDIVYLQADGWVTYFFCLEEDVLSRQRSLKRKVVSQNIGYYMDLLPDYFHRCHQSYIVNQGYVRLYNKSDQVLELQTGHKIPVSRKGKETLSLWLERS
ncbi:MAG: LytTR family DNA-binding domain-containing protein [Bacteroidota bacterium]